MTEFESQLIQHCSPTLLGLKQANLFSFEKEKIHNYATEIQSYNQCLNPLDIYIEALYCCPERIFLLVYNKEKMLQYLQTPAVSLFLEKEGYPAQPGVASNFRKVMAHLKQRTNNYSEFPHEIGFFLGYPLEDVFGFIHQKGKNYKCFGYWKVYGNESKAKKLFQQYESCRDILWKKATSGVPILTLLGAA